MPASGWRPFSGGKSLSIGLGGDRHVGDDDHHHMDDVDHHHVKDGDHHHISDGGHHVGDVPFEAVLVIFLSIIFVFVSYWHCIFPMDGECAWNSLQLRASSCGFLACHALTQLYLNAPHTPRDCHHHHHHHHYIILKSSMRSSQRPPIFMK